MEHTSASFCTIGRLARAAGVGVETIRYYQRRQLLPIPHSNSSGGFRAYPVALVDRIRFIKRAQELGFTLDEISHLLLLEDGDDRVAIRDVANERLLQVRAKLADLQKMEHMLSGLIQQCEASADAANCPIIHALAHSKPHC
ncbi:MerR family transcriptional regulator [Undibacterium sp. RTI2.1]|uniref:MerR family transcriptional regulator n=1 Tax=unclassified Undibacterium TaxID=2630295 RepID=UPI002AB42C2A|nr:MULTISPECIES: MerR family transcriptional regulator [unclassified Undibacterium]MDY7536713.1 MerR family transcriptional regulator [Undibacterium sp. 5I1]MEB0032096.1 MerR family transcriptional regulator [Undibacterium sp. RTI2.1]MEB0118343.1 MerR family transcriptional regulator [Undibacterium sp. RTI2.2]MEB0230242.1 MerR family transcriptional regulator [Undibacterium sp. 10I3]MEB0257942.1 MerR family transcriptional regulator [Undibacterium sp. 5I1]